MPVTSAFGRSFKSIWPLTMLMPVLLAGAASGLRFVDSVTAEQKYAVDPAEVPREPEHRMPMVAGSAERPQFHIGDAVIEVGPIAALHAANVYPAGVLIVVRAIIITWPELNLAAIEPARVVRLEH